MSTQGLVGDLFRQRHIVENCSCTSPQTCDILERFRWKQERAWSYLCTLAIRPSSLLCNLHSPCRFTAARQIQLFCKARCGSIRAKAHNRKFGVVDIVSERERLPFVAPEWRVTNNFINCCFTLGSHGSWCCTSCLLSSFHVYLWELIKSLKIFYNLLCHSGMTAAWHLNLVFTRGSVQAEAHSRKHSHSPQRGQFRYNDWYWQWPSRQLFPSSWAHQWRHNYDVEWKNNKNRLIFIGHNWRNCTHSA